MHQLEALLDCILVGSREGCVNQIATVRGAFRNRQLVAVLDGSLDFIKLTEVDVRIDALAEQVQAQCDQVDVSSALTIAE